jgi:hypothetical protein
MKIMLKNRKKMIFPLHEMDVIFKSKLLGSLLLIFLLPSLMLAQE